MGYIAELNRDFARPGVLQFERGPLGGTVLQLASRGHTATVALHGAQVLSWVHDGAEQLWLSSASSADDGRPIRGGIPVCWPWFGAHQSDPSKPSHGFARTRPWQVVRSRITSEPASVAATFAFVTPPVLASLWPHVAEARLTVTLGAGLDLKLETINTGERPLLLTDALHTYFAVSDVGRIVVDGLHGRTYLDKLDGDRPKVEAGPIRIAGEVDRIYLGDVRKLRLIDGARRLTITSAGSSSAVVWNPWIEKSRRLGDMGSDDAYRQMVCIETANAGTDQILLPPGARHALEASYRVG